MQMETELKKVITSTISEKQTGFIKGRYIGENVRLISEVIEKNPNKTDEYRLIFFTDFNKAFDSLYLSFLWKTLKIFNFSDSIIRWMQLLYNNA